MLCCPVKYIFLVDLRGSHVMHLHTGRWTLGVHPCTWYTHVVIGAWGERGPTWERIEWWKLYISTILFNPMSAPRCRVSPLSPHTSDSRRVARAWMKSRRSSASVDMQGDPEALWDGGLILWERLGHRCLRSTLLGRHHVPFLISHWYSYGQVSSAESDAC